ncbi:ECF-type riboflavin transporter substrate-binding protein [Terrisporobacter sp.]|uniref:ECF-type riboflavin transporter substrate-binding protein n=1 Tax=Terrisporobacter sp. TaxID=1965305 RepID=UPI00262ED6CB|nr:ECF-type riboflavin transporter substrate-binding protein [Terrisporobacter sp.]
MIKIDTKTIVTIGVAAALYGALGFVGIPIGPNTQLKPSIALIAVFSAMFGPFVGFSMGFIGHMLTDMIAGWGIWWGWVASSGILGLFMGLVFKCKNFSIKDGLCSKFHIIYLAVTGFLGIVLAYSFAAGFDIIFMGEPLDKMKIQTILAIVTNSIVFFGAGIPIILGFIKTNKRNSNLKIEE